MKVDELWWKKFGKDIIVNWTGKKASIPDLQTFRFTFAWEGDL